MKLQAQIWRKERKFEEAKSGALQAIDVYEKIGATAHTENSRALLRGIEKKMKTLGASGKPGFDGKPWKRFHLLRLLTPVLGAW